MNTSEGEVYRWLAYARSDLEAAQMLLQKPESYPLGNLFVLIWQSEV